MKIKRKNVGIAFLLATIMFCNLLFMNHTVVHATEAGGGATISELYISKNVEPFSVSAGDTVHIKVPIRVSQSISQSINVPSVMWELSEEESKIFDSVSEMTFTRPNYSGTIVALDPYQDTFLEFDVKIKESAKAGTYKINPSFAGSYTKINDLNVTNESFDGILKQSIKVKVINAKSAPSIVLDNAEFKDDLRPNDTFNIKLTLRNQGALTAKKVTVSVDGFATDGILPDYTSTKRQMADVEGFKSNTLSLPVHVSSSATEGVKTLKVKTTCEDVDGNKSEDTFEIYVPVQSKNGASTTDAPNILISGVKQTPSAPEAGGKVAISFVLENKSDADAFELKIAATNLTNANFSPVSSEPYMYIEKLAAGSKKKITMNYNLSKDIPDGLNELTMQIDYKDAKGTAATPITSKLYVLDVKNPEKTGETLGTPKLIISNYEVGTDDLRAASTFDFTFEVKNTHSTLSANNIKVTITSEENIFSVTKGSNSFYVNGIKPGESKEYTMQMKVKPDAKTQAYPLKVSFEYEYEGMPKLENAITTGITVSESLNIQVQENSRPTVNNIVVGTWEPPMVGTPTTVSFDFYNMGKSVLSNVTARVESTDFTANQVKFIGNVEAGAGNTQEIEVTPNVEGPVTGKLIITYEDSNGQIIEVPTDFPETFVQPMQSYEDPDMGGGEMPVVPEAKKPILPTWAFVLIQIAIFIIAIPVLRKIVISIYKAKLRKKEENL